jgi:molecular chaperone GrpE
MSEEKGKQDSNDSKFQVSDRRFWAVDETCVDRAEVPEARYPSFVEELKTRTEQAEKRLRERMQELDEESQASRARVTKEIEKRAEQEKLDLLRGFLEVVDNLERALDAADSGGDAGVLKEGVSLNLQLLLTKLKSSGIEPMDVLGKPFDPNESEAVGTVPTDQPEEDQLVLEILQQGYRCGDQLLRPARVRVGTYQDPGT